jgi:beta-galactosidase
MTIVVRNEVRNADGEFVANGSSTLKLKSNTSETTTIDILIPSASLWSIEKPHLYTCHTSIWIGGILTDSVADTFGIRKMVWSKDKGFILNDKHVKIKGMANHQDFAGVGVAVPDSLQAYRIWMHKQMGANAWRTAHNPPTSAVLDEADRQGLLVWNENHRNRDSPGMLDDLRALILRDRNHPSVFLWSLCNEALCEKFDAEAARVLRRVILKLDPLGQRPVTAAVNFVRPKTDPFNAVLDVAGINYQIDQYDVYHQSHSEQPIVASETSSDTADRGIYSTVYPASSQSNTMPRVMNGRSDANSSEGTMYLTNGGDSLPKWGATAEDAWCNIENRSFVSGGFYWTGFDYRGEPTPNKWPNVLSHFGVMDFAGFPKDKYYYHQSVFFDSQQRPILHLLPHWNWNSDHGLLCDGFCHPQRDGRPIVDVWAYTNGEEVELFLNNNSLGRRKAAGCRHVSWSVPFDAGELRAVAFRGGHVFATDSVETTGVRAVVGLETEWPLSKALTANGVDVALVTVRLQDTAGRLVRTASAPISFSLEGPGRIIGLGSGDPTSHEHDNPATSAVGRRTAWNGLARVVVQSTETSGLIRLRAESEGLAGAELVIQSS